MTWKKEEIMELIEEWLKTQEAPYRQSDFTKEKSYHPTSETIIKYCGKWNEVLEELGYTTGSMSKGKIKEKLISLDEEKEGVITQEIIRETEGISMGKFYSAYKSLPKFRRNHDMETFGDHYYSNESNEAKKVWKKNREKAKKRDNYRCQDCEKPEYKLDDELNIHHKIPRDAFRRNQDAHTLSNLISLCRSCHTSRHNEKYEKSVQTVQNA